jgi:hypothetical protein
MPTNEKPLSKNELLAILLLCQGNGDTEVAHSEADEALLRYINDPEITEAYERVDKWYA